MANEIKELQVYHASDMLMQGLKEYRIKQKDEMEGIIGVKVFDPSSQPFNNKKTADSFKLSERIVKSDTKAIEESDIYVIDLPVSGNGGLGTVTELGQIFQMKNESKRALMRLKEYKELAEELAEFDSVESINQEISYHQKVLNKKVLIYSSDIRWNTTDMSDDMDRVPYSFNAYVYGVALSLTNGKGVISWEQVKQELDELANGKLPEDSNVETKSNKEKRKYFNKKNKKKSLKNKLKRGK